MDDERVVGGQTGGRDPGQVALVAGAAHHHVRGPGDRGDPLPAAVHEVVDREPGAEHVVGIDVRALLVLGGPAAQDDGQPSGPDPLGQVVVVVQREQQHAVDVLPGEVVVEPPVALRGVREQQDQLEPGVAQCGADAADHSGEERLAEDPLLGLRDHHRDRVRALGDQRAGGLVGHVAELRDGALDRLPRPLGDLGAAVDDAGGRTAAHTGCRGHLLEGRPRARLPRHGVSMSPRAARTNCAYHAPLAFGVRRWVSKSTCTIPNRMA